MDQNGRNTEIDWNGMKSRTIFFNMYRLVRPMVQIIQPFWPNWTKIDYFAGKEHQVTDVNKQD